MIVASVIIEVPMPNTTRFLAHSPIPNLEGRRKISKEVKEKRRKGGRASFLILAFTHHRNLNLPVILIYDFPPEIWHTYINIKVCTTFEELWNS